MGTKVIDINLNEVKVIGQLEITVQVGEFDGTGVPVMVGITNNGLSEEDKKRAGYYAIGVLMSKFADVDVPGVEIVDVTEDVINDKKKKGD